MADREREKAASKALRRLTPFLVKNLSTDVRHELYARDMLTWHEKDTIAAKAEKESSHSANEAILSALERRGPDALDVLIESLESEEDVNQHIIDKIRKEFKDASAPRVRPIAVRTAMEQKEVNIPIEGTDRPTKLVYKMSANPRGIALIINNKYFTNGMKDRVGTDRDAESLTSLCQYLGFDTRRYNDRNGQQMRAVFDEIRRTDHTNYDCLFICLLSHGINGKIYSIDGELLAVEKITEYFDGNHCPSLIGKPKVFIIQACRGAKFDYGVSVESTDGPSPPVKMDTEEEISQILDGDETDGGGYTGALPTEADFILAYATVPGYVSWRNSENGAWFVSAFVQTMKEYGKKEHLLDILTEVNRRVAEEFQSRGRNKQIPAPVSMLTRKLYFRPGSSS